MSDASVKVDIRQRSSPLVVTDGASTSTLQDKNEEKKLLKKIDWRIVPWIFCLYFLSVEDRSNVGFAMTMNKDVNHTLADTAGLTPQENNIGLGLFYVAYIIFEVPSNLMMAHVNPAHWIARIMITWSIVVCCMVAISKAWHFYLLRFLLGLFEAGFWPAYYYTLWYTPEEISARLGVVYLAGPTSGAFGGLISAAVQLIDTRGNLYGWQWLFLFSGLISIIFGVITIFYLPSTPEKSTKFLTEDERVRIKKRLEASTQERAVLDTVEERNMKRNLKQVLSEFKDFKIWLFCVLYFTPVMAATSLGYFIPKIVQQMGTFTSIQVSLMSIPPFVFGCIMVYILTRLSDHCNNRGFFIIGASCAAFVGFCILSFAEPIGARYFGLMVLAGGTYPTVPLSMAWTANSKEDPVAVASATGIVSSVANFGALICTFALYSGWASDAPRYIGSNMINGGAMLIAAICAFGLRIHLSKLNKIIERDGYVGDRTYPYIL
ncbi:major facilitator superfamily domain-containing protein [Mucor mucedo]|uniref:major facilitator superfamily domain-containing protein n=1 Tax=Mucor mucedo TaxID=29922 RepID=UPI00221F3DCA|nr:major facilitator superfamily domain-containing protein [Mucor mucedo]KAI7897009.1 major facilitator superfamily domain-containing protein [Mucor mucedo]